MREKYTGRKIMSICSSCEFMEYLDYLDDFVCAAKNAAITNYVHGLSMCSDLNSDGTCVLWSEMPPCECEECQAKRNNQIPVDEIESLCKTNGVN